MRRHRTLIAAIAVILLVALLLLAMCPKNPPHPVPADERDPLGEIHHDGR